MKKPAFLLMHYRTTVQFLTDCYGTVHMYDSSNGQYRDWRLQHCCVTALSQELCTSSLSSVQMVNTF